MQQRWLRRHRTLLGLVLGALLVSAAQAGGEPIKTGPASAQLLLKPFKAYYQAMFDLGINISGEAVLSCTM